MNRQGELRSVVIERRLVPPPASISPEARAYLSAAAALPPWSAFPPLPDTAGWVRWIRELEALTQGLLVAQDLRAQVQTRDVVLNGVISYVATPRDLADDACQSVFLDIHGGAFVTGGGEMCRYTGMAAALRVGARSVAVDYRMPPAHPYPAPLDDCLAVYKALLETHRPQDIVVGGLSAGGNLAAALMLRARDEGLPLPAGLVLLTPELDLTESGDSFQVNLAVDVGLPRGLAEVNTLYADGETLADPYLSPLFGDFARGFPPTLLQAGTRDLFLSNAVRMHRALRKAAIEVELHVFEGMPHAGFFGAPEDLELGLEVRRFAQACWHRSA